MNNKYNIILEHTYSAFCRQDDRKRDLETKTSYLLTVALILLGFIIEFVDIKHIFEIQTYDMKFIIITVFISIIYFATLGVIFTVIIMYIRILFNKIYANINVDKMVEKEFLEKDESDICKQLSEKYADFCDENTEINDKQASNFKIATIFLYVALLLLVVMYILFIFV